ncbi:hypothetical protein BG006_002181 [Podila minutissima]|uniref:F-box domain-containing protein n=1 Tax=Podila minutissima TaxID=64525 RepID=A0A9P5SPE1_9FUNG|nr:hypothetical protein BG006_002181 [Podila minutissima]
MTSAITVFEIPHLQTQICRHLANRDIYHCIHVSKDWSQNFGSYLWHNVHIFYKHELKKFVAALTRRPLDHTRHHVRTLTIYYAKLAPLFLGQKGKYEERARHKMHFARHRCAFSDLASALEHLSLNRTRSPIMPVPQLQQLEIGYFDYNDDVMASELGDLVATHPTLQEFALKAHGYVNTTVARLLLRSGSGLHRLELHCVPVSYPVIYTDEDKRLMFDMPYPVLRHLVLDSSYSSVPLRPTDPTTRPFSRKHDLIESAADKEELVHPRLESFNIKNGEMIKSLTVQTLILHHHTTLTQVSVPGCRNISGVDLQQMLLSLPNLIRFQATNDSSAFSNGRVDPVLRVKDMLSSAPLANDRGGGYQSGEMWIVPWACTGLMELHLRYQETEREPFPRQVYDQISKLRRLEKLCVQRQAIVLPTMSEITPTTTTSTGNSAEGHDHGEGTKGEGVEDISTAQDPAKSKKEPTEEEKQIADREGNVEAALNSLKVLRQLRVLDLTELHPFVYTTQLHEMKKALPHLDWIQLYGDD